MSLYRNRAIAYHGYMGSAFGILPEILAVMSKTGGAPPELFPGGPSFVGWDDAPIFYGTNAGFLQGAASIGYVFTPPSDATVRAAASTWAQLQSPVSPADDAFKAKTNADLNLYLKSFSNAVANHSGFGYSQDAQKRVVEYANQLKRLVTSIAMYRPTPAPVVPTDLPAVVVSPTGAAAASTAGGAVGPGTVVSGTPWLLYAGIGLGVVALLGGAFALTRRRGRVAGFRRRRRR